MIVNGIEIVEGGELTGARPGRVLRRGRDTDDQSRAGDLGATAGAP
jgi:hypothetical protein